MIHILAVGLGGMCGAIGRYWISTWLQNQAGSDAFPIGVLAVNVLGCFVIGLASGIVEAREVLSPPARLLLFSGFLGSFTTYSTFSYDTFLLARDGSVISALLNVGLHLVLGLGAVGLGYAVSRIFA